MLKLNVHEAKTRLSHYLDEVEKGEKIILCRRNRPVAEIRAIPGSLRKPRPIGLAKGMFSVPPSFFEELPEETIRSFDGDTP
jgi:antitoxin (DNA-binding transcriptional repressor) of toxin-antitoxin stability system